MMTFTTWSHTYPTLRLMGFEPLNINQSIAGEIPQVNNSLNFTSTGYRDNSLWKVDNSTYYVENVDTPWGD